jgi:hypothetical protein
MSSSSLLVYAYGPGGPCIGFGFIPGREYIIFASRNEQWLRQGLALKIPGDNYVIDLCGGTAELHNVPGNLRLQEVRKIIAAKPPLRAKE